MAIYGVATGPGRDGGERAEDAGLARAAAEGSRKALGTLFRRYAADLYRLAHRITGNRADAEDTVQDVFVGLPRALQRYREQGCLRAWLRQVTARTALSRIRTRERRVLETLDGTDLPLPVAAGDPVDRVALAQALAEMPEPLRLVFLLKEVEGYDHGEIGALLSITPGAARVRLHRAWRFLEARVGEEPRREEGR